MAYDVIFDKGHGIDTYERTGGKGVVLDGIVYEEHTANADIGDRVIPVLRAHGLNVLDIQPSMQKEVRLNDRMAIANRKGAKLYWSTHFNAGDEDVKGVCAFYSAYASVNERTKALAEQYAKNAEEMGITTHGNGTHASHYNSWTNFAVTRMTEMDSVLCENGFMTNDEDFEGIFGKNKEEYHQKIAELQIKTILEYFGKKYDETIRRNPAPDKKVDAVETPWYLRKGDSGAEVKTMQQKLIKLGYDLGEYGADGVYGQDSVDAVKAFQRHEDITVDGLYGVGSREAMETADSIKPSFKLPHATYYYRDYMDLPKFHGSGVKNVQEALASIYFYPNKSAKDKGIDSWYGVNTADAVKRFQSTHGLKEDGDYGSKTRAKLIQALK